MKIKKVISFIMMGFIGLFTICMLNKTSLAADESVYKYTFTGGVFKTNDEAVPLGDITWKPDTAITFAGYDNTKGQQFGSSKSPMKALKLTSTTAFSNVTSIIINAAGASSINGNVSISVGDVSLGTESLTSSSKNYTFNTDSLLNGSISIAYTQTTSKALYLKSIEVFADTVTKYDVKYFDGETELTDLTESVEENGFATVPTAPAKTGFIFDGWYTTSELTEKFSFDETPIIGATSIYAKYVEEASATTYTVTYYDTGDSTIEPSVVIEGNTVIRPADPVKEGFAFDGWFTNEECTDSYIFNTAVTADINLYAKWVQEFSVTFDTDGGNSIPSQTVKAGALITKPADPTKKDVSFDNWYTSTRYETIFDFTKPVTSNVTIYAKWNDKFVTVDSMRFDIVRSTENVTSGLYVIGADMFMSNEYDSSSRLKSSATPNAYFYFDKLENGNFNIYNLYGKKMGLSKASTGADITFGYSNSYSEFKISIVDGVTSITLSTVDNLTIQLNSSSNNFFRAYTTSNMAKPDAYKCSSDFVTVTFDVGGQTYGKAGLPVGSSIAKPEINPTLSGLAFSGWYKDSACTESFDFETETFSTNTVIYSKFINAAGQVFETYSTQAGLNFHYTYTDGVYSVDNVTLRLGMSGVSIDAYNEDATYGILLIQKSEITNTSFHKLISDYKEGFTIAELLELTQGSYDIRNYELTPARVNADGIADPNGDYFQCASVFTDMENDFTTEVAAVAYMELDGVVYIMDDRTTSLSKLAGQYINNPELTGITDDATLNDILGALEVIKNGGNA